MGCASSKHVEPMDVYRPTGASLALFNLDSIEEPWLKQQQQQPQPQPKSGMGVEVPKPLLEKLNTFELAPDAPHSWSEVSKALEDLKPTLDQKPKTQPGPETEKPAGELPAEEKKQPIGKKQSFHTLEELDAKLKPKPEPKAQPPTNQNGLSPAKPIVESTKYGKLKDNYFLVMDRLQRNKDDKSMPRFPRRKRDPLEGLPEKCPPAGADKIVLYTTTLRGVRRTFEDCKRAKSVMEGYRAAVDERDVSLHLDYLTELRELVGEGISVPRLFIKGRYVGGVEEMVDLNERGKLGEMLETVGPESENSGEVCEACGDLRFIPCLDCSGSCKVVDEKEVFVRCTRCNENGLIMCPVCH